MLEPYEFNKSDELIYFFKTEFNIEYKVNLFSFEYMFHQYENISKYIYSFELSVVGKFKKTPLDSRIGITVALILQDFFQKGENAVIYVCESLDNR